MKTVLPAASRSYQFRKFSLVISGLLLVLPAQAAEKYFAPAFAATESGLFYGSSNVLQLSDWRDNLGVVSPASPIVTDTAKINGFDFQNSSTVAFTLPATSAALTVFDEAVFNLGGYTYTVTGLTQLGAGGGPIVSFTLSGGMLSTVAVSSASAGSTITVPVGATLQITNSSASSFGVILSSTALLTVNGTFTSAGGPVSVGLDSGEATFTLAGAAATGSAAELRVGEDSGDADSIAGTGKLNVTDGATLSVSKSGSGYLRVGYGGAGALNVQTGSKVSVDNQLILGNMAGASGTAIVDGANSKITIAGSGYLYVGPYGNGQVEVRNNGAVSTGNLSLARYAGGNSAVILDGSGSRIDVTSTAAGSTRVGRDGNGSLLIRNGGDMTAVSCEIAYSAGASGSVTVTGSGSTLVASAAIGVGGSTSASGGTGTLTVASGGFVSTSNTMKFWDGGTLILDDGTVKATGGFTFTSADVKGSGTIDGNVNSSGTTYTPGASPGLLAITGWLTLTSTDTLKMELGGSAPSLFDRFSVGGVVTLGNATLNLSLLPGFETNAAVNDTLTLINNTGSSPINGKFAGIAEGASIIIGTATFTASYVGGDGNDFVLKVAQLPGDSAGGSSGSAAPQITAISPVGSDMQITFSTVTGKKYRIEYRDDLATGTWQVLRDNIDGTGGSIPVPDTGAGSMDKRFYRLVLLP